MNKGALIVVTWLLLFTIISAIAADYRGKEIKELKNQIKSIKLENQLLKDELKPYQEAKAYIQRVNPGAVHRTGQIVNGAKRHDLPLKLVLLSIHAESDFNWNAVGRAGERGPLQVMPGTFKMVHRGNFGNMDDCFEAGLRYLSLCYKKSRGDYNLALAYYNGGLSCKKPLQVARAHVSRCNGIRRRYWEVVMCTNGAKG